MPWLQFRDSEISFIQHIRAKAGALTLELVAERRIMTAFIFHNNTGIKELHGSTQLATTLASVGKRAIFVDLPQKALLAALSLAGASPRHADPAGVDSVTLETF